MASSLVATGAGEVGGVMDDNTRGTSHICHAFPEIDITVAYSISVVRGTGDKPEYCGYGYEATGIAPKEPTAAKSGEMHTTQSLFAGSSPGL